MVRLACTVRLCCVTAEMTATRELDGIQASRVNENGNNVLPTYLPTSLSSRLISYSSVQVMTKCDILEFTITVGRPNTSVGIVIGLKFGRPMNRDSISGRGILIFPKMSRTVLGPTQPPLQLEPGVIFRG